MEVSNNNLIYKKSIYLQQIDDFLDPNSFTRSKTNQTITDDEDYGEGSGVFKNSRN